MDELTSRPLLRAAYDYWSDRCAGRPMPARRDLDPVDIPRLLPYVILVDVLSEEPLDMRYRLIGTAVRDRIRIDMTRTRLLDVPGQGPGSVVWDTRARCVQTRAPVYDDQTPYVGPSEYVRRVRQGHLPLSEDGRVVNMIMTVVDFEEFRR